MHAQNRYRVEHDDDELFAEPVTFQTIEGAKALALHKLAYGYRSRVLDLVTGTQVFPPLDTDSLVA